MPIKFRCAYCNQLMGIARRKAGSVVNCPTCHGKVVVPTPPPEVLPMELPSGPHAGQDARHNAFDQQDFDPALFNPNATHNPPTMPSPPSMEFDAHPVPLSAGPKTWPPAAAKMTRKQRVRLWVGAVVLAALAFAAGFAVAKLM